MQWTCVTSDNAVGQQMTQHYISSVQFQTPCEAPCELQANETDPALEKASNVFLSSITCVNILEMLLICHIFIIGSLVPAGY